jgi:plasmid stabilization system protein ParE
MCKRSAYVLKRSIGANPLCGKRFDELYNTKIRKFRGNIYVFYFGRVFNHYEAKIMILLNV